MVLEDLNPKQRVFVERYLTHWNATRAAEEAGYAHPNQQGPRLLVNVGIAEAIKIRLAEVAMGADEVLIRLGQQARNKAADYLQVGEQGGGFIDLHALRDAGLGHLVRGIKQTRYGQEVELFDAQAALVHLGKHHRLFTEQLELTGRGGKDLRIVYVNDWRDPEADPSAVSPSGTAEGEE